MKEKAMHLYPKINKAMRTLLSICLASLLLAALMGFQDFKKEGVQCRFRARIVDIQKPPTGMQVLIVKALSPTTTGSRDKARTIDVFVTSETISRAGDRFLNFNDFRVGMLIEIQGLKAIEQEDGQDKTFVLADRITQLVG
jgi:hypothetical protein